jgi:hypothetical protein
MVRHHAQCPGGCDGAGWRSAVAIGCALRQPFEESFVTRFVSMTHVMRSHVDPYLRLFWFLHEAMEREHRLNIQAMSSTPAAFLHAWMCIATSGKPPAPAGRLASRPQPGWPTPRPLRVRSVSRLTRPRGLPRDAPLHPGWSLSAR